MWYNSGYQRSSFGYRLKAKRGIYEMNKDFYRPRLSCHAANIKLFYHTGFKPNSFFSLIFSKSNLSGKNQFYNAIFKFFKSQNIDEKIKLFIYNEAKKKITCIFTFHSLHSLWTGQLKYHF